MRTKEELEKARLPQVQMIKSNYSLISNNPAEDVNIGDLVPKEMPGETFEEQILEVLLDIRTSLTDERK